jgi:Zn-dependent metalloprotease
MLFNQEYVNEAIICGICNTVLKNPRLLPCSESACHECIQFKIYTDPNQEFNCQFCKRKHTPGKDGFPLNGALMKLLIAKSDSNVYRNEQVDRLKEKLADIKSKCGKFELSSENGVDQVRKNCKQLRKQVEVETEKLINEAHKFNDSLIAVINHYEEEYIKSFKSNATKKNDKLNEFIGMVTEVTQATDATQANEVTKAFQATQACKAAEATAATQAAEVTEATQASEDTYGIILSGNRLMPCPIEGCTLSFKAKCLKRHMNHCIEKSLKYSKLT